MGAEKERGTQLSQILLCVLVIIFASCAIVFVALYFIKYGEDNGKDHSYVKYCMAVVFWKNCHTFNFITNFKIRSIEIKYQI